MIKTVQNMVDFINQGRPRVAAALDGVVRIQHEGVTNGINWQIEYVTNNDRLPITRWKTDHGQFLGGFLLVVSNVKGMGIQTGALPKGDWAGMATDYFLNMYLETMDLRISDLPDFNNAEILKGSQIGLNDQVRVFTNSLAGTQNWFSPEKKKLLVKSCQVE